MLGATHEGATQSQNMIPQLCQRCISLIFDSSISLFLSSNLANSASHLSRRITLYHDETNKSLPEPSYLCCPSWAFSLRSHGTSRSEFNALGH